MADVVDYSDFGVEHKKKQCDAACRLLTKTHLQTVTWTKIKQPIHKNKLLIACEDELLVLQTYRAKLAHENEKVLQKVNKTFIKRK